MLVRGLVLQAAFEKQPEEGGLMFSSGDPRAQSSSLVWCECIISWPLTEWFTQACIKCRTQQHNPKSYM